jgi:hypothetical protein
MAGNFTPNSTCDCCQKPPDVDIGFEFETRTFYGDIPCWAGSDSFGVKYGTQKTISPRTTKTENVELLGTFDRTQSPNCSYSRECSPYSFSEQATTTTTTTYAGQQLGGAFYTEGGGSGTTTTQFSRSVVVTDDCQLLVNSIFVSTDPNAGYSTSSYEESNTNCSGMVQYTVLNSDDPDYQVSCEGNFVSVNNQGCFFDIQCDNDTAGNIGSLAMGQTTSTTQIGASAALGSPITFEYSGQISPITSEGNTFGVYDDMDSLQYTISSAVSAYNAAYPSGEFQKSVTKYRLVHQPSVTCYLKVWIKRVTVCSVGEDESEEEDMLEYEWTGASTNGKLCLDPPFSSGFPSAISIPPESWKNNKIESTFSGELSPESAAGQTCSVYLQIFKYSFLKDYEPNDPNEFGNQGCKPNGYPDPLCGVQPI